MKKIPLTKGKFALVDDDDFEKLSKYKWHMLKYYAARTRRITDGKKSPTQIYMHRIILNTPKGKQTDHINGNYLDNRKENLRVCKIYQNRRNVSKRKDNTTGQKGVTIDTRYGFRWLARISVNGEKKYLGTFLTKEEAAQAYRKAALKYHRKFARFN